MSSYSYLTASERVMIVGVCFRSAIADSGRARGGACGVYPSRRVCPARCRLRPGPAAHGATAASPCSPPAGRCVDRHAGLLRGPVRFVPAGRRREPQWHDSPLPAQGHDPGRLAPRRACRRSPGGPATRPWKCSVVRAGKGGTGRWNDSPPRGDARPWATLYNQP